MSLSSVPSENPRPKVYSGAPTETSISISLPTTPAKNYDIISGSSNPQVPLTFGSMSPTSSHKHYHTALTFIAAGMPPRAALSFHDGGLVSSDGVRLSEENSMADIARFLGHREEKAGGKLQIIDKATGSKNDATTDPTINANIETRVSEHQLIMDMARFCAQSWGISDEDIAWARRMMIEKPLKDNAENTTGGEKQLDVKQEEQEREQMMKIKHEHIKEIPGADNPRQSTEGKSVTETPDNGYEITLHVCAYEVEVFKKTFRVVFWFWAGLILLYAVYGTLALAGMLPYEFL